MFNRLVNLPFQSIIQISSYNDWGIVYEANRGTS